MNEDEKANWLKIKEHMEKVGCTDNLFYTRAVAISNDKPDPIEPLK